MAVIIFSNLVTVVMKETVSSVKLYSENWNKASTVLDHTIEARGYFENAENKIFRYFENSFKNRITKIKNSLI